MSNNKTKLSMYHITFYPEPEGEILHCTNIEASSMLIALKSFYAKFPDKEPLYIHHKK